MASEQTGANSIYEYCLVLGLSSNVRQKASTIFTRTSEVPGVGEGYSPTERMGGSVYSAALICNETARLQELANAANVNTRRLENCANEQLRMVGMR